MSAFQGIWVALVTPFHNGEIDFASLDRLTAKLLEDGVGVSWSVAPPAKLPH